MARALQLPAKLIYLTILGSPAASRSKRSRRAVWEKSHGLGASGIWTLSLVHRMVGLLYEECLVWSGYFKHIVLLIFSKHVLHQELSHKARPWTVLYSEAFSTQILIGRTLPSS